MQQWIRMGCFRLIIVRAVLWILQKWIRRLDRMQCNFRISQRCILLILEQWRTGEWTISNLWVQITKWLLQVTCNTQWKKQHDNQCDVLSVSGFYECLGQAVPVEPYAFDWFFVDAINKCELLYVESLDDGGELISWFSPSPPLWLPCSPKYAFGLIFFIRRPRRGTCSGCLCRKSSINDFTSLIGPCRPTCILLAPLSWLAPEFCTSSRNLCCKYSCCNWMAGDERGIDVTKLVSVAVAAANDASEQLFCSDFGRIFLENRMLFKNHSRDYIHKLGYW